MARLRHVVEIQGLIRSGSWPRDELVPLIAQRAEAVTGADGALVEILERDVLVCRSASGLAAAHLGDRFGPESSLSGHCVHLGVTVRCTDAEHDARVHLAGCRALGIRSMVAAPLKRGERSLGVLKVVSVEPDHFSDPDMEVLQELAGYITGLITAV